MDINGSMGVAYFGNNGSITTNNPPGWFPITCLVCGILGFFSNLLVFTVLVKQRRRKPFTRRYSISLTLGNLVYSIAAVDVYIFSVIADSPSQFSCTIYTFLDYFGYYICVASLVLLAVGRFCAIKFPVYFRKMTSLGNVRIQVASAWLICLLLAVYPTSIYQVVQDTENSRWYCDFVDHRSLNVYNYVFDMILPMVLFIGLTVFTIIMLKKRSRIAVTDTGVINTDRRNSLAKPRVYLTFVIAMFILCFGPYFLYALVLISSPELENSHWMVFGSEIVLLLTFWHTWLNPIMHCYCDENFRKGISELVSCKNKKMAEGSRESGLPVSTAERKM